jgi:enamine deaminase RidA (YjgF/YER057c/UK114 family)
MPHQHIASNPALPFSDAVFVDGRTLYISGRIGLIPGTTQVPDRIDQEIVYLMEDLRSVLSSAGMTLDDLVSLQIFCPNVSLWEQFNGIYRTFFDGPLPARAVLGSGPLLFGAHFEVMGIAVKPAPPRRRRKQISVP